MPNTVNTGLAGAIVSLLAHLRNQGRKNGVSAPEEPAATSGQAAPPPQAPSAAPTGGDSAVRFDFSAPPAQAATALAAAPATAVVKAAAPAAHVAATPLSAAAGSAAAQGGNSAGAATPRASGTGGQKGAGAAPAPFSEPARLPEPADLDDEARARAWAIRTIARENTLSMIGQIARVSERPEAGKAGTESGHGSHAARDSEPRTLARA